MSVVVIVQADNKDDNMTPHYWPVSEGNPWVAGGDLGLATDTPYGGWGRGWTTRLQF